jgi:hypothetical protein
MSAHTNDKHKIAGSHVRWALAAVASIVMTCAAQAQQYPPGYYAPAPPPQYYPPPSPSYYPPPLDPIAAFFGALFRLPFSDGMLVPDGRGGWVPFTNSRVMPDGTLRPFDPAIDGPPPGFEPPVPLQGRSGDVLAFPPQGRSELAPPPVGSGRSSAPRHVENPASTPCYDGNGRFIQPPTPDCKGQ